MINEPKSYRRILKSTSITGGSTLVTIFVGIIRTKIVAIILGPSGVGIYGLFQSFIATASTFSGVGIATAASREIAEANEKDSKVDFLETIQALLFGTIILAVLSGFAIWFFREEFAMLVFGNIKDANYIGWLAIAVSFSVISASQLAIIQGVRDIAKLARLNVLSSIVGSTIGVIVTLLFGQFGLISLALAIPICSVIFGVYAIKNNFKLLEGAINITKVFNKFSLMAKLGIALFFYAVLEQITFLLVRGSIRNTLGVDSLGYFQAGYTIAVMYLGVITGAMASDFMPRIAENIGDNGKINKIINHQTEVGLLIASPIIVLMIGYAPMIISLMYSKEFISSVQLMRVLLLSDILKLISWPVGIALIGMGDGAAFARQGPVQLVIFYIGIIILMPSIGLISIGYMMILIQIIGTIWGFYYLFLKTGYKLERKILNFAVISELIIILNYYVSILNDIAGIIFSSLFSFSIMIYSYSNIKLKIK